MTNTFAKAAVNTAHETRTENGQLAMNTTGNAVLDLYSLAGALRDSDASRIHLLLDEAVGENPLLAAKAMFYTRDVRGGIGERQTFRTMLRRAADRYPNIVSENIALIGEYGRYDDMYALVGTKLEDKMWSVMKEIFEADRTSLAAGEPVTLLAKWIKSPNSKSAQTRALGRLTCKKLGYTEPEFRKILSALRSCENVVEQHMSANTWSDIDYSTVPSRASLLYRNAFASHDRERYAEFLSQVNNGATEIKTTGITPYDLVHDIYRNGREDATVETMWKNLPEYVDSNTNVMCMVDTSGSMSGRPIEVALGLGLYFAEKNTGDFHNLFMTFSAYPKFVHVPENTSLAKKLHSMEQAKWGMNTNLTAAFTEVLDLAVRNHVPTEDMPKSILIISDMEIDSCTDRSDTMFFDYVEAMYAEAGYKVPNLIFWNVNSRHNTFHADKSRKGCQLASGESIAVFKQVIDCIGLTPEEAMLKVLNSERYEAVTVK